MSSKKQNKNAKKKGHMFQEVLTYEQITETLTNTVDGQKINHIAVSGVDAPEGASAICASLVQTLSLSHNNILFIKVHNGAQTNPAGFVAHFEQVLKHQNKDSDGDTIQIELSTKDLPRPASTQEDLLKTMMQDLENIFDIIIWDLPPTDKSARSRMVAQYTQGVVLVVEAGKTRWQTANHTMEHFRFSGCTILGVILNKKKNYIPNWIYKLLFRDS